MKKPLFKSNFSVHATEFSRFGALVQTVASNTENSFTFCAVALGGGMEINMSVLEKIDKNFVVDSNVEREGLLFRDVKSAPFKIYGIYFDGEQFRRLPAEVAEKCNEGVLKLSSNTAGGRVRFITDSPYVVIKAVLGSEFHSSSKMPASGTTGFDLYMQVEGGEDTYFKTFIPPAQFEDKYASAIDFFEDEGRRERLITINFPLYNDVYSLEIGLADDAVLKEAPEYKISTPFVYYGSSVTQGGCASRPGTAYQAFITRWLDADHINLGFSGSAKAEEAIAEYVAGLDTSLFVYDYDHNAPSFEWLVDTHERMYRIFREKHPTTPIIMTTKPIWTQNSDDKRRMKHIKENYKRWVEEGDENLYLVTGPELLKYAGSDATVDRIHPNDLGFYSMARSLAEIIEKIFPKKD